MENQDDILDIVPELTLMNLGQKQFTVALVGEQDFLDAPMCPHCLATNEPYMLDENMSLESNVAELMLCSVCVQPFVVTSFPLIDLEPVFVQFTLKEGYQSHMLSAVAEASADRIMDELVGIPGGD